MAEMNRAEIIAALVENGNRKDKAVFYTDAYLTHQEASENVQRNGAIVNHPRTGNPIINPYLQIRDTAAKTLGALKLKGADFLWEPTRST
jgi:phage terminase small subunit